MTASASASTSVSAAALQRQKSSFIAVFPKDFGDLSSSEAGDHMSDPMDASSSSLSSPSTSTSGDDEPQHCGRLSASSVEQQGNKGTRKGGVKRRYYLQLPTPPPSPFSAYSNGEPLPSGGGGSALPALPETPTKGRNGLFTKKIEIAKRGSSRRAAGPSAASAGKAVGRGLGNFILGCFGTGEMVY